MNCYYHPEVNSVATCIDCGKGLCQECAGRYQAPICNECNERRTNNEKATVLKQFIPSIIFFVIGLMFGLKVIGYDVGMSIVAGYAIAGLFWGWKVISFIQPKMFMFLSVFGWVIYFGLKLTLSMLVGVVAMPIGIIKMIISLIIAISKGKNIERNKQNM